MKVEEAIEDVDEGDKSDESEGREMDDFIKQQDKVYNGPRDILFNEN